MMQAEARERIFALCEELDLRRGNLMVDADAHITDLECSPRKQTPHYYHGRPISAEELLLEMDASDVQMANVWQNPATTVYTADAAQNVEAMLAANRYVHVSAMRYPDRLIGSGWTDPKACGLDGAKRIADVCVLEFGFLIVKMNPAQNRYPMDSPEVIAMVDHIVGLGAIPTFHYGADTPFTPAAGLEAIARRHPDHPVLAIHMGGGGAGYLEAEEQYQESRELGLRYGNIYYALSALRDTHIESAIVAYEAAGGAARRRLFCASDAPYGRVSWNFGGFRAMLGTLPLDEASKRGYLGGNFAEFVRRGYEALLARHA